MNPDEEINWSLLVFGTSPRAAGWFGLIDAKPAERHDYLVGSKRDNHNSITAA